MRNVSVNQRNPDGSISINARLSSGDSQLGDHVVSTVKVSRSVTIGNRKTRIGRRVQVPIRNGTPANTRIWGTPKSSVGKR